MQETASHLSRFLAEQLDGERLRPADPTRGTAADAVGAVRQALGEVHDAAGQLAGLLGSAELALLALAPRRPER